MIQDISNGIFVLSPGSCHWSGTRGAGGQKIIFSEHGHVFNPRKLFLFLPHFDLDFNLSSLPSSFTLFHNPVAQCLPKMLARTYLRLQYQKIDRSIQV